MKRDRPVTSTKGVVLALCRQKGYELGGVSHFLGIEWHIALHRSDGGRTMVAFEAKEDTIPQMYGALAVWLRVRPDVQHAEDERTL